jgi:hypothetical protein
VFHDSILADVAEELHHWWRVEGLAGGFDGLVER